MEIQQIHNSLETLKLRSQNGGEYWMGRDIQPILGYSSWEGFERVIQRARKACESIGADPDRHFHRTVKVAKKRDGTDTKMEDYYLDRYACYLIAISAQTPEGDIAKNYFIAKARLQELEEAKTDQQKRLEARQRVKDANRNLNAAAKNAGVLHYGLFHDAGYRGLYEMDLADIKKKKGISSKEDLLDRAGRMELAANEFRITLTEERIKNENIKGEKSARDAHHYVGQEVRKTIRTAGGTPPENLPVEPSIKKLIQQKKKEPKSLPEK